jgi:peroxiredoxin
MLIILVFSCLTLCAGPAFCASLLKEGEVLPDMELTTPSAESDRQYLGVTEPTFKLGHVEARVIVVEIIGVYCPYCYEQAPLFRNLFNRLQKGKLKEKVKMFGIAAGGTAMEVEYLRKEGQYNYPLVQDPQYRIHKLLGEPRTPFTLLVDNKGKLLYVHPGTIKDIEPLYVRIAKLAE